ncbi:MAG TPA: lipopolysaccharide biosynthesis protein [Beijerinckiaceae bacterium]|nr:lipopolysaccharide biosynthesis protein [Beijerinckiaceae bacterium]
MIPFAPGLSSRTAAVRDRALRLARHENLLAVLKSASLVFVIRIAGAGLTYASMICLARWLGAFDFGIYAFVSVIVTLVGLALSAGFNSSALRFIPDYLARQKWQRLSGFLARSYAIVFAISVLGALIAAALVVAFRGMIEPYYFVPLLVGLLCVPVWTLLSQGEVTARAFGWVHLAYVPGYIARPVLLLMFVGGLLLVRPADAVAALWGFMGACAVAALGQGVILHRRIRERVTAPGARHHTQHWLTISLGFLMVDGFRMLLDNADVLLIGKLLDPHSVAVYYAAIRTGGLVAFVSFSIIALAVPKFAEIHATGTRAELQKFVTGVIQMTFWPSLLAAVALAALGPFVMSLFGPDFEGGYATMLVVLAGLVLRAATAPAEHLLNVTGYHRDTMRVYAVAAIANVALNLLLIPRLGIMGAAIATYTAMLSGNAWLYVLVRRRLGVSAFVFGARARA